ncbi:MAG: hypothetical protein ABJG78_10535 [Cyclobacteriaceae bacterium]
MKKNIIIVLLLFATILFGFYGSIKASEAEKNLVVAQEQKAAAQKNAMEALAQSQLAIARAAEAEEARATAEQLKWELERCRSK